jgi:hypothetical protein
VPPLLSHRIIVTLRDHVRICGGESRGGFVQFLLRGLEKVKIECKITATAHNLLKIIGAIMKKEKTHLAMV